MISLVLAVAAIAVAYAAAIAGASAAGWSAWLMAGGTSVAMVATMALGAACTGRADAGLRRLIIPFGAVLLVMLGAFTAALVLPGEGEPLWLGLPRRAAIVLYGIGLIPALILPLAYALTFDEVTLTEDDVRRVRDAAQGNTPE